MIYYKEKRTPFHLFHRNLNLIRLFVHRHINNAEIHSCNLNKNNKSSLALPFGHPFCTLSVFFKIFEVSWQVL